MCATPKKKKTMTADPNAPRCHVCLSTRRRYDDVDSVFDASVLSTWRDEHTQHGGGDGASQPDPRRLPQGRRGAPQQQQRAGGGRASYGTPSGSVLSSAMSTSTAATADGGGLRPPAETLAAQSALAAQRADGTGTAYGAGGAAAAKRRAEATAKASGEVDPNGGSLARFTRSMNMEGGMRGVKSQFRPRDRAEGNFHGVLHDLIDRLKVELAAVVPEFAPSMLVPPPEKPPDAQREEIYYPSAVWDNDRDHLKAEMARPEREDRLQSHAHRSAVRVPDRVVYAFDRSAAKGKARDDEERTNYKVDPKRELKSCHSHFTWLSVLARHSDKHATTGVAAMKRAEKLEARARRAPSRRRQRVARDEEDDRVARATHPPRSWWRRVRIAS